MEQWLCGMKRKGTSCEMGREVNRKEGKEVKGKSKVEENCGIRERRGGRR